MDHFFDTTGILEKLKEAESKITDAGIEATDIPDFEPYFNKYEMFAGGFGISKNKGSAFITDQKTTNSPNTTQTLRESVIVISNNFRERLSLINNCGMGAEQSHSLKNKEEMTKEFLFNFFDPSEWVFDGISKSTYTGDEISLSFVSKDMKVTTTVGIRNSGISVTNHYWDLKVFNDTESRFLDYFQEFIKEKNVDEKKANAKIIMKKENNMILHDNPVNSFDIDFDRHYNEDITEFNDWMAKWDDWKDPNNRLTILYGPAGTGKTNWIKNYIQTTTRQVIYVPPSMSNMLAHPEFCEFMYQHKESLLIVEDAEQVLEKRENTSDRAVSDILNLTDGMLADFLDLRIIATHNKDKSWIDTALRRDGRCYCEYEFRKLAKDRTKAICDEIGSEPISDEMTLSEIYRNMDGFSQDGQEAKFMGFA